MRSLSLLGTFDARLDGKPVKEFESNKVRALLVYLALEADKPHSRERLAGMFWGESNDETAAKNLRQALSNLRKAIHDDEIDPPLLAATPVSIQANRDSDLWLDAREFESFLSACQTHPHRHLETCSACALKMEKALSLYRGGFLEGFFLREADVFQDWIAARREHFHQQAADAAHALITYYRRRGELKPAIAHAQRLVSFDPWREEAHAALMELLARDGQRSAALKQYETCRAVLMKELGVEPQEETVRLVEAIRNGTQPEVEDGIAPCNLPHELTAFIGRKAELEHLSDLLQRTDSRLVTLTGLGGSGKTRLAIQAAHNECFAFRDGVFLVSLSSLANPSLIPLAIAEAIGFSFASSGDPQTQLLNHLKKKELLLALDNVEHLLDGLDILPRILQTCPSVNLLVTSREPLRLQAEWVLTVTGLGLSAADDTQTDSPTPVSDSWKSDSLQLFENRARHTRRDFELTGEAILEVEELCGLLNGLPLGIEIAAALLKQFSIREINRQIRQSLDFLSISLRDVPERHRSLRAIFDQSWDSLAAEEQRILARLSVFQGEFSREAAMAVSLARPDQLESLADKSLVNFDGENTHHLHELTRQYCAQFLQAETEDVIQRFIGYFAEYVSRREPRLVTEGQKEAITDLERNIHHIRRAWRWAVERKLAGSLNAMFRGLHYYLDLRGWLVEGDILFGGAAAQLKDSASSAEELIVAGKLIVGQGWFNFRLGQAEKVWKTLDDNIAIFEALQSSPQAAFTLNYLGIMAFARGDFPRSREYYEASVHLYRQDGNQQEIAKGLNNLGLAIQKMGELEKAAHLFQESVDLRAQLGDRRGVSTSLANLGMAQCLLGNLDKAQEHFERCLIIDHDLGDRYGIAISLFNLGYVSLYRGQFDEAERLLLESLALSRATQERPVIVDTLLILADIHRKSARVGQALRSLQEGFTLAQETQSSPLIARALLGYAEHAVAQCDWDFAAELCGHLIAHCQDAETLQRAREIAACMESRLARETLTAALDRGTQGSQHEMGIAVRRRDRQWAE